MRNQIEAHTRNASDFEKDYFSLISSERWGLFASAGENYRSGVFGRDSIEAADEVLDFNSTLARRVIVTMASLQGVTHNPQNEEEPGRIHHEYRELTDQSSASDRRIFHNLSENWGRESKLDINGNNMEIMAYYGSVDATPLFVRLVGRYCDKYGPELLNDKILSERDGEYRTMSEHLQMAANWVYNRIANSEWKLLEYKRENPRGIPNQVWKDSETSYIHEDGTPANSDSGIASVEVQGYAYDALATAARYIGDDEQRQTYRRQAQELQRNVLRTMWVTPQQDERSPFFAMGVDRDAHGDMRQIRTRSSNAGLLLDSNLLRDLPEDQRRTYVDPVVDTLMSDEFLTPVGIRCRSVLYPSIVDYADYHGTYAVWPKETSDIAHGLYRHGYFVAGLELSRRIVEVVEDTDMQFYEFYFVDLDNKIRTPDEIDPISNDTIFHWDERMNKPEPFQAWTISAYEFHKRQLKRNTIQRAA